jgi:hypothetical protein
MVKRDLDRNAGFGVNGIFACNVKLSEDDGLVTITVYAFCVGRILCAVTARNESSFEEVM